MSTRPPDDTVPDGDDLVAAEYVLGVLAAEERREAARRIETDPKFARLVTRWQEYFSALDDGFEPVSAPHYIKGQVDHRLFGTDAPTLAMPLWTSLAFWRGVALAAIVLAVIGFGRDLIQHPSAPAQFVASMAADNSPVHTVAVYDEQTKRLKVTVVAGDMPPDRSLELWLIAGNEAPVSLGLMKSPQVTQFTLPQAVAAKLRDGTTLALSIEPLGGSPSGAPTGPVVAAGTVRAI